MERSTSISTATDGLWALRSNRQAAFLMQRYSLGPTLADWPREPDLGRRSVRVVGPRVADPHDDNRYSFCRRVADGHHEVSLDDGRASLRVMPTTPSAV
jgi:hypothetical protein